MDIIKLRREQIYAFCKSCLEHYTNCLTQEDLQHLKKSLIHDKMDESFLLKISKKIWDYELSLDKYSVISWNKYAKETSDGPIVFATLQVKNDFTDAFCHSTEGIEYNISFEAIIGALNKDGATLIEKEDKENAYTISKLPDGKVVNSYNGATKFITPIQLLDKTGNAYHSKHNELILDASRITRKGKIHFQ